MNTLNSSYSRLTRIFKHRGTIYIYIYIYRLRTPLRYISNSRVHFQKRVLLKPRDRIIVPRNTKYTIFSVYGNTIYQVCTSYRPLRNNNAATNERGKNQENGEPRRKREMETNKRKEKKKRKRNGGNKFLRYSVFDVTRH